MQLPRQGQRVEHLADRGDRPFETGELQFQVQETDVERQLDALALGPFILRAQDMPPFIEDGRFPLPGED
jgi:hypothetical protein